MSRDFTMRFAMIVHSPEVIAVGHRCESAIQWKNFESMAGKIEIANDLRTQQRHDVRANGKPESRKHFFRASRAPEDVAPLQHEHFLTGFGQIGGVGEAVVAAADYDYIVFLAA